MSYEPPQDGPNQGDTPFGATPDNGPQPGQNTPNSEHGQGPAPSQGPYNGPPPQGQYVQKPPMSPKDECLWGMLAHLSALLSIVVGGSFANIVGPLIIWLVKRDESPFVEHHGREALNFNISVAIYMVVCVPFVFCFYIGFLMILGVGVLWVVCTIMAAIEANSGRPYRYPLSIRFISEPTQPIPPYQQ